MVFETLDDLNLAVRKRLAKPGYDSTYPSEAAFEADVWRRLVTLFRRDAGAWCLTSHKEHVGRSLAAWKAFCSKECGPDVSVLGSKNRLDIVVEHPVGSIGIEVKYLANARKLTQGLGQAMLALACRDRTLLVIHCGTAGSEDRQRLRKVADKISKESPLSIIVAP